MSPTSKTRHKLKLTQFTGECSDDLTPPRAESGSPNEFLFHHTLMSFFHKAKEQFKNPVSNIFGLV